MIRWIALLIILVFLVAARWFLWGYEIGKTVTHAQEPPRSWLIWQGDKNGLAGPLGPYLYKVQDGACSVYVAVYASGGVAVATGQGCK